MEYGSQNYIIIGIFCSLFKLYIIKLRLFNSHAFFMVINMCVLLPCCKEAVTHSMSTGYLAIKDHCKHTKNHSFLFSQVSTFNSHLLPLFQLCLSIIFFDELFQFGDQLLCDSHLKHFSGKVSSPIMYTCLLYTSRCV